MLEAIGLEWAQLLTHTVGFLIALWLLKKYAWGPLLALMDERREKIAGEFGEIDKQKQEAADLTAEYESKLREIDNERRVKLAQAVSEGKKIAEEIKSTAHQNARDISAKARADLERDVAKAKVQLKDEMIAITMSAAEKIINEKLDDAKHRELIGSFVDGAQKA